MINTKLKDFEKHPAMAYAQDLKILCKPLEYLDITTFSHLRVFTDNRLTVLCNRPEFLLNYLQKKYYEADPCVNINPEPVDFGQFLIWDAVDCSGKTAEMLADSADFNFRHVFTIIKKQYEFTDFYHFGTHLGNSGINQIYVNNLDLLNRFVHHFNEQIKSSIALNRAYDMPLNSDQKKSSWGIKSEQLLQNVSERRQFFLNELEAGNSILTFKEYECAMLVIAGKTAKEIAMELNKSHRTVQDRINSLKFKLHARNKGELIVKLVEKYRGAG